MGQESKRFRGQKGSSSWLRTTVFKANWVFVLGGLFKKENNPLRWGMSAKREVTPWFCGSKRTILGLSMIVWASRQRGKQVWVYLLGFAIGFWVGLSWAVCKKRETTQNGRCLERCKWAKGKKGNSPSLRKDVCRETTLCFQGRQWNPANNDGRCPWVFRSSPSWTAPKSTSGVSGY